MNSNATAAATEQEMLVALTPYALGSHLFLLLLNRFFVRKGQL